MRPAAYRIHTSAPIERAFMTRRRWQHPGRREHIHGRIRAADDDARPMWANAIVIALFIAAAALCTIKGWGW